MRRSGSSVLVLRVQSGQGCLVGLSKGQQEWWEWWESEGRESFKRSKGGEDGDSRRKRVAG